MANLLRRDRVLLEAAIASPRHSSPRCAASTLALKRERPRAPAVDWSNDELAKKFLSTFSTKFGVSTPEGFYKVKASDLRKAGGEQLLKRFGGEMMRLAQFAFPGHSFIPWLFERVPSKFWLSKVNHKLYLDWLGRQLRFSKPEDWCQLRVHHFYDHRGGPLLLRHYNSSPFEIVSSLFPEYNLHPWQFGHMVKNYFDNKENRAAYITWLVEKVKVGSANELKGDHFLENGGGGFLQKYGNSPHKAVASLNDDDSGTSKESYSQNDIPSHKPKRYWVVLENQRSFLDEVAKKFGQTPGDHAAWYNRTNKDLLGQGSSPLYLYNNSLYKMLLKVYPEYEWLPWKFKRHPGKFLDDPIVVHKLIHTIENELNIKDANEWYRVSMDRVKDLGLEKLFRRARLVSLLRICYPKVDWNEKYLLGAGYKKASQHWLGIALREIFPTFEVLEEYSVKSEPGLIGSSESSSSTVRFDFFIPNLKLAFEYQGAQHYEQLTTYGDSKERMNLDNEKRFLSHKMGITIVPVPYWWDGSRSNLLSSIVDKRPDLASVL